ncbi:DNA-directed RNA polymerase II subunit RPB1 [Spatholobus suberectus]|nr:DNA-directed RNA polymerase II subunit RPB1 [Spatholobus suberectus]
MQNRHTIPLHLFFTLTMVSPITPTPPPSILAPSPPTQQLNNIINALIGAGRLHCVAKPAIEFKTRREDRKQKKRKPSSLSALAFFSHFHPVTVTCNLKRANQNNQETQRTTPHNAKPPHYYSPSPLPRTHNGVPHHPTPPPPISAPSPPTRQLNNIVDALIGAGDFTAWVSILSSENATLLPVSATLFVPRDGAAVDRPPPDPFLLPYHVVPQRLLFADLLLLPRLARLPPSSPESPSPSPTTPPPTSPSTPPPSPTPTSSPPPPSPSTASPPSSTTPSSATASPHRRRSCPSATPSAPSGTRVRRAPASTTSFCSSSVSFFVCCSERQVLRGFFDSCVF